MTSRELVYATLDFQGPSRIPLDLWILPSSWYGREEALRAVLERYPRDIAGAPCSNPYLYVVPPETGYRQGTYTDIWGSEWLVLQAGMVGEVKRAPLADYDALRTYEWPTDAVDQGWDETAAAVAAQREKFVLGFAGNPFERMQFLRGPEELYVDLADEDCAAVYELRDRVFAFYRGIVERWLAYDVDAVHFNDDWGSQRSLLIAPAKWRSFFKPKYQELFDLVRDAGKRIFFHSDGYIMDIYPDLIELGVSAVNSQVWCMGVEQVARYAGQITFWGEISRQTILPHGTPDDVRAAARQMVQHLWNNGGLIGQSEIDHLTPLPNVEALLTAWR